MSRPLVLLGLAVLSLLTGCYTVPETGRQSLILPIVDDAAQGAAAFAEIKAKEKISADPAVNQRITRIGQRIAQAVGPAMPNARWEFVVFDAPDTVNAFALPGGKVGIYTGLIRLAANDDEIAIVMGHEVAHVTARHGAERMSQGVVAAALGVAVDAAARDSRNRDLWRLAYGVGATGATLAFSRANESEADYIGLRYAARAGYDPRAAVGFWRKMQAQGGAKPPKWLSTHPPDAERIANLQRWMPEVLPLYQPPGR